METYSYETLLARVAKATDWLRTIGLNIAPTRFGLHRNALGRIVEGRKSGEFETLVIPDRFREAVASVLEGAELVEVHEAFQHALPRALEPRLGDYVRGPRTEDRERSGTVTTRGRDVGFELFLAAKLQKAGLALDFSGPADLWIRRGDRLCPVECKRPQSEDAVGGVVDKARHQIKQRRKAMPTAEPGIIALSIGKALHRGEVLLCVGSERDLRDRLREIVHGFICQHRRHWKWKGNQTVAGVLVSFLAPAVIGESTLTTAHQLGLNNCLGAWGEKHPGFVEVVTTLGAQQIGRG